MKIPAPARNDAVLLMDTAMQWLLRLRDESVTEIDIAQWLSWYEQDEAHKRAFDDAQQFWNDAGALASGSDGAQRMQRLHAGGHARSQMPALGTGTHAAGTRWQRWNACTSPSRRRLAGALGATAACLLIVLFARQAGIGDASTPPPAMAALAPDVRTMALPDGSQVDLAARSSVEPRYSRSQRLLEMRGEAYFSVQPDRQRPFIVDVGSLHVRAVGTAFNIRQASGRVIVTVAHGTVEVYPPVDAGIAGDATDAAGSRSRTVRVHAGSQAIWVEGAPRPVVAVVDPARALAWRQGRLEFIDEPLSAVVVEVNRYATRPVEIADEQAAGLVYTGTVLTRATDEWLMALPANFPVRLINDNDRIVIAHSPPAAVPAQE